MTVAAIEVLVLVGPFVICRGLRTSFLHALYRWSYAVYFVLGIDTAASETPLLCTPFAGCSACGCSDCAESEGARGGAAALCCACCMVTAHERARKWGRALGRLPREDPPTHTEMFYLIQSPVEENNIGSAFVPKLPAILSTLDDSAKLRVVRMLTEANEQRVDAFLSRLAEGLDNIATDVELQLVDTVRKVSTGHVHMKHNRKTDESILAKASRPSIKAASPLFGIEHIRDCFRFKAVVHSFHDALLVIQRLAMDASLCPKGLTPENVVKLDVLKLIQPKEWGWRFIGFDLVMPNRQICELYIVFKELERAKKEAPARSQDEVKCRCYELSNHEIFERWRTADIASLSSERRAEYEADRAESNRRYDAAWRTVLSHTPTAEIEAFWSAFAEQESG